MALQIDVDRKRLWHPGDIVRGKVTLKAYEQINLDNLRVSLEGRMKTKETRSRGNNGSVTYRAVVTLFLCQRVLLRGPYTLRPSTQTWDFEFEFPVDCRDTRLPLNPRPPTRVDLISNLGFNPRGPPRQLNGDPSLQLPPTMEANNSETFFSSGQKSCYISYRINAKLELTSSWKGNIEAGAPLTLEPFRDEQHRTPNTGFVEWSHRWHIRSYYLDPQYEGKELSFKEKMKTTFSTKVPSGMAGLNISLPTVLAPGQTIPILLGATPPKVEGSEKAAPPEVVLLNLSVTIIAIVTQMLRGGEGTFSDKDHVTSFENEFTATHWHGKVPINGGVDTRDLRTKYTRPWTLLTPSFKSVTIGKQYFIRVEGLLECAKVKEKFLSFMKPVTILPRECVGFAEPVDVPLENLQIEEAYEYLPWIPQYRKSHLQTLKVMSIICQHTRKLWVQKPDLDPFLNSFIVQSAQNGDRHGRELPPILASSDTKDSRPKVDGHEQRCRDRSEFKMYLPTDG